MLCQEERGGRGSKRGRGVGSCSASLTLYLVPVQLAASEML